MAYNDWEFGMGAGPYPEGYRADSVENSKDNDRDAHNQAISQVFFRAFIGYKRDFFGYEKKHYE